MLDFPQSPLASSDRNLRPAATVVVALVALLAIHSLLLGDCIRRNFVAFDESMHIPAGISHWKSGDFSMYHVNPPLPRMIAALPVLAAGPVTSGIIPWNAPGTRAEVYAAREFARDNAGRYMNLVSYARLAGIGWSLIGACLVFGWARDLYGAGAGLLAAALWCLEPNVLAHAQMATPDIPATVAGLGACYAFWLYLKSPSWSFAAAVGVFLGVAQSTKFTWLVLYAVWPLVAVQYRLGRQDSGCRQASLRALAGQGCVIVAMSLLTVNMAYGFDRCLMPLKRYDFISGPLPGAGASGAGWKAGPLGAVPIPLPAEYLRGIDHQKADFEGMYRSYLRGEWRSHGWWYYYAYAAGVKVPIGYLVLALLGIVLAVARRADVHRTDEVVLWAPALAVFVLVSSQTGINHHLRYILPAFPFAMIATGKVAPLLGGGRRWPWLVVGGLLGWGVLSTVSIHPHYLSYFNEAAGGPERGHDHLVDSNIDWGQDLLFLERWLDDHPEARPLKLAFYHLIDPRLRGIAYSLPPTASDGGPVPGHQAVSVNLLRGATAAIPDGRGGLVGVAPHEYEYFRRFTPIARAGYSIYIYHITPEDVAAVSERFHRSQPQR